MSTKSIKLQNAEINLRLAAIEWDVMSKIHVTDPHDLEFKKIDLKLMRAALKYAKEKNVN